MSLLLIKLDSRKNNNTRLQNCWCKFW